MTPDEARAAYADSVLDAWNQHGWDARGQGRPRDLEVFAVYVARVDGCGHVKIGFSRRPERRMAEVRCPCGGRPELVWCVPGSVVHEHALQHMHHEFWLRGGEWFAPEVWGALETLRAGLGA